MKRVESINDILYCSPSCPHLEGERESVNISSSSRHAWRAETTGEPVEVDQLMDECDGTATECTFDLVRRMIRGDGSRFTIRTHCH